MPHSQPRRSGVLLTAPAARKGGHFDDRNEELMKRLHERFPNAACMEMETFQLLDLAARSYGSIRATAAAIVVRVALPHARPAP